MPYLIQDNLISPILTQEQYPPAYGGMTITSKYVTTDIKESVSFDYIKKVVFAHQERLKKLSEIAELTGFFFKDTIDYPKDLLRWKEMKDEEIKLSIDKSINILSKVNNWQLEEIEKELLKEANNFKNRGELLWPLRVALSGKKASAPPFQIAEILGKERTIKRLKEATEIVS